MGFEWCLDLLHVIDLWGLVVLLVSRFLVGCYGGLVVMVIRLYGL